MGEARPSTPELYDLRPFGPQEDPREAVRVLVQTRTHLLPGADYYEKLNFMLDLICNHVWGRRFINRRDRFHIYGPPFGRRNHRVYFVVDHGQTSDDSTVPILWYQLTAAADPLKLIPHKLPKSYQNILQEYPFTRPSKADRPKAPEMSDIDLRRDIRFDLYDEKPLRERQITFLIEHPEHLEWIKDHVEPRFWASAETRLKERQDEGRESGQPQNQSPNRSTSLLQADVDRFESALAFKENSE